MENGNEKLVGKRRFPRMFAIDAILIFVFAIPIVSGSLIQLAAAQPVSGTDCQLQISQTASAQDSLDKSLAIPLAQSNIQVKDLSKSYTVTFYSIFDNWKYDSSCNVKLLSVNVVYALKDSHGVAGVAVATEDPTISVVSAVTLQLHNPRANSVSTNWSGYNFDYGGAGAVYQATGSWNIPAVTQPSSTACYSPACLLAVWPGLTNDGTGVNGIAQAGSMSKVTFVTGYPCSINYYLWYQFFPNSLVDCLETGVAASDSISTTILNHGYNGGSTSLWDITVTDSTLSGSCTVTNQSFTLSNGATPKFASFISERPSLPPLATLPSFSSYSWGGSIYYGGSWHGISVPYGLGNYEAIDMQNTCGGTTYTNISTGTVSGSNVFTVTYNNSNCT